jgi:uncharacterized protein YjbI with pentapeptide repeats
MSTVYPLDLQRHVDRIWAMRIAFTTPHAVSRASSDLAGNAGDFPAREIEIGEVAAALEQHRAWLNNNNERVGHRADLSGTRLASLSFWGADLTEAELRGADLRGCDLDHAQLSRAVLSAACLSSASCWGANMSQAVLAKADLSGAKLDHADLRGADLRGADLTNASLWGAHLEGADLRGVVGLASSDHS